MKKRNEILSYFAETNSSHLHAKGKRGTTALIESLDCKEGEAILEIGFGTGATLVQLAAHYKKTHFHGAEISNIMYDKAFQRLTFCQLDKKVNLQLMNNRDQLPFENNTFDKVYMESILAIQEGMTLKQFLLEIKRVLKPSGMLVMNETIWIESTTPSEIQEINKNCKLHFGIIQSNSLFPYLKNWKALLEELHFEVNSSEAIDELVLTAKHDSSENIRSHVFTFLGKVKAKIKPALLKEMKEYQSAMKLNMLQNRQLMAGYLIKANNKK